jgi:hypothetical protein
LSKASGFFLFEEVAECAERIVGVLLSEALGCMLSVGRKLKTEIPV